MSWTHSQLAFLADIANRKSAAFVAGYRVKDARKLGFDVEFVDALRAVEDAERRAGELALARLASGEPPAPAKPLKTVYINGVPIETTDPSSIILNPGQEMGRWTAPLLMVLGLLLLCFGVCATIFGFGTTTLWAQVAGPTALLVALATMALAWWEG